MVGRDMTHRFPEVTQRAQSAGRCDPAAQKSENDDGQCGLVKGTLEMAGDIQVARHMPFDHGTTPVEGDFGLFPGRILHPRGDDARACEGPRPVQGIIDQIVDRVVPRRRGQDEHAGIPERQLHSERQSPGFTAC